eukprot:2546507-Amphidinium_carterae.1
MELYVEVCAKHMHKHLRCKGVSQGPLLPSQQPQTIILHTPIPQPSGKDEQGRKDMQLSCNNT